MSENKSKQNCFDKTFCVFRSFKFKLSRRYVIIIYLIEYIIFLCPSATFLKVIFSVCFFYHSGSQKPRKKIHKDAILQSQKVLAFFWPQSNCTNLRKKWQQISSTRVRLLLTPFFPFTRFNALHKPWSVINN